MARKDEKGGRSYWLAEILERDDSGAPARVRVIERAEDVEGQGFSSKGLGETGADVEGQGARFSGLGESEADVEGHGGRWSYLRPADDDAEGQGMGYRGLGEAGVDVEGQGLKWRLVPDESAEGQVLVIGEGIPATERIAGRTFVVDDDVEGQGGRFSY